MVWLLEGTKGWTSDKIEQAIKSGDQVNVNLTKPIPLHWVYVTGWSASDGVVQFREDIYSRDGLGAPGESPATTKLLAAGANREWRVGNSRPQRRSRFASRNPPGAKLATLVAWEDSVSEQVKYVLDEAHIPKSWYNIIRRTSQAHGAGSASWHAETHRPGRPRPAVSDEPHPPGSQHGERNRNS